jgi:hypothetical protein
MRKLDFVAVTKLYLIIQLVSSWLCKIILKNTSEALLK